MDRDVVTLTLSSSEAQTLYAHLHQLPQGQEIFEETYLQLQKHFFQRLTVDELTILLGRHP